MRGRIGLLAVVGGLLIAMPGWRALAAGVDPLEVWTAAGGEVRLELRADVLSGLGLEVVQEGRSVRGVVEMRRRLAPGDFLAIEAPQGRFQHFLGGRIALDSGWLLRHRGREVRLDGLVLTPHLAPHRQPTLVARDAAGRHLLTLTHLHVVAEPSRGRLTVHDADMVASRRLAELLGLAELAGLPIGMAWLDLPLDVPAGAATASGASDACARQPAWPQDGHVVDIRLIDIESVVQRSPAEPATGHIKLVPSATLKNVGEGDVPWIPKFNSIEVYPYDPPDQHPFLVWNLYRIAGGRIEQLAASGAKHAYFAANTNCTNCGSPNVLWPGCEDVYGVGTNERGTNLGPRDEVVASQGLFRSACSSFDRDCDGRQDPDAGSATYENRLLVDPAELETPGAEYFLDAWYLVQYDADIWNSMGYRALTPRRVGEVWTFELGEFVNGRVVDRWVEPGVHGDAAEHVLVSVPSATPDAPYPGNLARGHLSVLVRIREVAPGRFRYFYAVQNFDFDGGVESFRIPLPAGTRVFDTGFHDLDDDPVNDWTVSHGVSGVIFLAPPGNALGWSTLYNFEVDVDAAPVAGGIGLGFGAGAGKTAERVPILSPAPCSGACGGWEGPRRPFRRPVVEFDEPQRATPRSQRLDAIPKSDEDGSGRLHSRSRSARPRAHHAGPGSGR